MDAIETPRKSSNIETALLIVFSNTRLPHLTLSCTEFKKQSFRSRNEPTQAYCLKGYMSATTQRFIKI